MKPYPFKFWIIFSGAILLLCACEPVPVLTPTIQLQNTAATPTSTPAPTITSTAPVSAQPPVRLGTPIPSLTQTISAQNAGELRLISQWGYGRGNDIAWSPDGSQLAVAASSGLLVFDAENLSLIASIPLDSAALTVAYSPNADLLAAGCQNGEIYLFERAGFSSVKRIATRQMFIAALVFSNDGQQLAAATWDNILLGINPASGEIHQISTSLQSAPQALIFDPQSQLIYAWGPRDPLQIWTVPDSKLEKEWYIGTAGQGRTATGGAFSANAAWFAAIQGQRVRIFNTANGTSLALVSGFSQPVRAAALTGDGGLLATISGQRVQLWNSNGGTLLSELPFSPEGQALDHLAFSPQGDRLAALGDGLIVWQIPTPDLPASFQMIKGFQSGYPLFARVENDADQMLSAWTDGRLISQSLRDGQTNLVAQAPASAVDCLDLSPDHTRLVYCAGETSLYLAETGSVNPPTRLRGHTSIPSLARFSPDGQTFVSSANDRTLRVWGAQSGENLAQIQLPASASSLTFSPQGAILAISDGERTWLWNTSEWSILQEVPGSRPVFSGDGQHLAVARLDATRQQWIEIYAVGANQPSPAIFAEGSWFSLSQDGNLLVVAGQQISLWETKSARLLWQTPNPLPGARIGFSMNTDRIILSGSDGRLMIYAIAE